MAAGEAVAYLPDYGLGDFDLVLSYTGGGSLRALRTRLGARRVRRRGVGSVGHVHVRPPTPGAPSCEA